MRYTLQINTGSFIRPSALRGDSLDKFRRCLDALDVERVIFGWSPERAVNEAIISALTDKGVEKYIWLPVFSEVRDLPGAEPLLPIRGGNDRPMRVCDGETFDFVCPSSKANLEAAVATFDMLTAALPIDGAFIDRIRYASAAHSASALYGCWCDRCRARCESAGIDAGRIEALAAEGLDPFVPDRLESGRCRFADADVDALFAVKRRTVLEAVDFLREALGRRGAKLGIDTFAPVVSDFVGQDSFELARRADFIKPMMYLRTYAPAGVSFELDALGTAVAGRLRELWGVCPGGTEAFERQTQWLNGVRGNAAPGIDVNRIDGICDATPEYALDLIARSESARCASVVLSWDVLRMEDGMIDRIAARHHSVS